MHSIYHTSILSAAMLLSACSLDTDAKVTSAPVAQTVALLPAIMPSTGSSFSELARKALAIGDAAAALPLAERALEANPDDGDAKAVLAEALLGNGRADEAEKIFISLIASNSGDLSARTGRAMALLAMGQPQAAKADLLAVIAAKPSVSVLSNAGLALALAGDPKAAVAALAPLAFATDSAPQLRQNYALALTLAGDRATAYKVAEFDLGASRAMTQVNAWYAYADKPLPQQLAALTGLPSQSGTKPANMAAAALPTVKASVKAGPAKMDIAKVAPVKATPILTDSVSAPGVATSVEPINLLPDGAALTPTEKAPALKAPPAKAPTVKAPSAKAVVIHTEAKPAPVLATSVSLRPTSSKQAGFTASSAAPAALRGWLVQVAAVSPNVSGKLLSARLRKQFGSFFGKLGPITHSKAVVGKQAVKRVFIGPYRSAQQASQVCARIKARGSSCMVRAAAAPAAQAAATTKI
jgi:Flp pilus assembly protein TadD